MKEKRDELRATESYRKKRAVTRDIVLKRRMRVNNLEIQRVWAQARYNCLELVVITAFGAFVMHFLQPDWPLATSIYWAVETFTTVGYGDVVPTTKLSRWFFIVFALFGTILFAKAVGYMLVLPNTLDKIKQDNHRLSQFNKGVNESMLDEFFAIDAAHGFLCDASRAGRKLSRAEFIVHVLVILERVTPHQVWGCGGPGVRRLPATNDCLETAAMFEGRGRFAKGRRGCVRHTGAIGLARVPDDASPMVFPCPPHHDLTPTTTTTTGARHAGNLRATRRERQPDTRPRRRALVPPAAEHARPYQHLRLRPEHVRHLQDLSRREHCGGHERAVGADARAEPRNAAEARSA